MHRYERNKAHKKEGHPLQERTPTMQNHSYRIIIKSLQN